MVEHMTFEQAMSRLEELSAALQQKDIALDESLKLFSESTQLLLFCNQLLDSAEQQVERILPQKDNEKNGEVEHG